MKDEEAPRILNLNYRMTCVYSILNGTCIGHASSHSQTLLFKHVHFRSGVDGLLLFERTTFRLAKNKMLFEQAKKG